MRILLITRNPRRLFEKILSTIDLTHTGGEGYIALSLRYDGVVLESNDEKILNTVLGILRSNHECARLIHRIRRMS